MNHEKWFKEVRTYNDKIELHTDVSSTKIEGNFFSVAMTTPLAAARMKEYPSVNTSRPFTLIS